MAWTQTANIKGPAGATGSTGAQGPQGNPGVGFTWRGVWSGSTAYAVNDCVSRTNQSYVCTVASTGNDPATDTTHWNLMAAQGATGATGATGSQGPAGPTAVSADAGNQSKLGSDSLLYTPGGVNGFVSKTAAYTLTLADRNKLFLCSGGSWTLTLPAAAIGLCFNIRNDMGISGTTGTITLSPSAGTIDSVASVSLLPQQECLLVCDGTNWRTFGKQRVIVLGTIDITTSIASTSFLLPLGYRQFEIELKDYISAVNRDNLQAQFSTDGGSTWKAASYYEGIIYDNGPTTTGYTVNAGTTFATISSVGNTTGPYGCLTHMKLSPGSAIVQPSYIIYSEGFDSAANRIRQYITTGMLATTPYASINALKLNGASGNITNLAVTVKGFV